MACSVVSCGDQSDRLLIPRHSGERASVARRSDAAGDVGPRICFFNEFFDYCYPSGGYLPGPTTEVPLEVEAGRAVTLNWYGEPQPGRSIRAYKWALDLQDISDETPRMDEATDLAHWSQRTADTRSVRLGPWTLGEVHRLYVDVGDDFGFRSLGTVRFTVVAAANRPPACGTAAAVPATLWPPDHRFVAVGIAGVTDPDGDPVAFQVTRVTQDEPVCDFDSRDDEDAAMGSGIGRAGGAMAAEDRMPLEGGPVIEHAGWRNRGPDAVIRPDGSIQVRAERSAQGNGRVYAISFIASDPHGGSCEGTVRVCVPHSRRHRECIDDGQRFNSLERCRPHGRGSVHDEFSRSER